MEILDFIEAEDAEQAITVFREDNQWLEASEFVEFLCIRVEGDFTRFGMDTGHD
jgi:hypothetical protein